MISVAATSCGERAERDASVIDVQVSDSAGIVMVALVGEVESLPHWTLSEQPIADIRGDTEPFIGRIGQVALLADGSVLVEDAQDAALYRFDGSGPDFTVLGREGDGPGEFRAIAGLSLIGADTAVVYDRRLNRISMFTPEGAFVQSMPLDANATTEGVVPRRAWAVDPNGFVFQGSSALESEVESMNARRDQRNVVLRFLDRSGRATGETVSFVGGYTIRAILEGRGIIIVAPFANVPIVAAGGDRVVYGSGLSYDLTVARGDLTPVRVIRWHGWTEPLTQETIQTARSEAHAQFVASFPERADLITDAMFAAELLPETMPALGSALVDDLGRIWVARFQPSTQRWNQRTAWHVLEADGTPLARITLPDRARLVAVRGERIAVVVRDELDVEHLTVHSLERAGM